MKRHYNCVLFRVNPPEAEQEQEQERQGEQEQERQQGFLWERQFDPTSLLKRTSKPKRRPLARLANGGQIGNVVIFFVVILVFFFYSPRITRQTH